MPVSYEVRAYEGTIVTGCSYEHELRLWQANVSYVMILRHNNAQPHHDVILPLSLQPPNSNYRYVSSRATFVV